MPRRNTGPKLQIRNQPGSARGLYYVVWTENGRSKRKSTGIPASEPEKAQAWLGEWLRQGARAKRNGPGHPTEVRVADVIDDYVAEHGGEVVGVETLRRSARHLLWFFADDTIATMMPNRVKTYWEWRRTHSTRAVDDTEITVVDVASAIADGKTKPTANGTIIRELAGVLRPAIDHAINERRLTAGTYYVPVPPQPRGRELWITRAEAARLLWETRRDRRSRLHLPLFTLVALYTGQRRGAILDLQWTQIDFTRGHVNFNRPGRVQTAKRRPIIPIPRSLMAALRRAHRRSNSAFVIAYAYGDGGRVGSVKKGFNSAADRAGIPDCTSHTLRHTAGTWMAHRGVPLYEIAGYLGHSEQRTTELYAHHHPDHMAHAKRAMEGR